MKMSLTTKSIHTPSARLLEWDTEFWKMRVGVGNALLDQWALDNTIGCLFMLFGSDEQQAIHEAEAGGARFMDFRVEYACDTYRSVKQARPVREDDIEPLAQIARTAFRGLTRFYADPHFDDERCDDLYENWFRENADDPNIDILMWGDRRGPTGFVTVKMDKDEASIVLIAVADRARGKGIGKYLSSSAADHAYWKGIPRISVVTQGCNIASQRAFQATGFSIRSSGVWMHKHFQHD